MRPGKIAPAWTAAEAADRIRERFNEKVTGVEPCFPPLSGGQPSCYAVGVEDSRGLAGVRIVERASYARAADAAPGLSAFPRGQMRPLLMAGGSPTQTAFTTIPTGDDLQPFRFRLPDAPARPDQQPIERFDDSYDRVEAALRELDGALTAADVQFSADVFLPFARQIRKWMDDRKRTRRSALETELAALDEQGRILLATSEAAREAQADSQIAFRNARGKAKAANAHLGAVKSQRPQDSKFPRPAEIATWRDSVASAQREANEADAALESARRDWQQTQAVAGRAKADLENLRSRRRAVQQQLGVTVGEETPDVEAESLVLRA